MSAELLVSAAAWFVASFVGGLCGIGAAAIATAMQILVMPVQKVVLVSCLTALVLGTAMALRYGRQCRWKTALLLFAGALPGSWAGLFVLAHASAATLEVVVGVMLVFCTVGMALFRKVAFLKESAAASLIVGFAGGALGTSVNIDGPVVALYGLQAGWSPMVFLGTTSVYFALRLVLTCTVQASAGLYTPDVLKLALVCMPFSLAGLALAMPIVKRVRLDVFRRVVEAVIVLAGVLCLGRALF